MDKSTRFYEWIVRAEHSNDTQHLQLERLTRPLRVGKVATPDSLDDMTIGQMVQLSECQDGRGMFYTICSVLLGMDKKAVDNCWAVDIVRFCGWVLGQVQRINALFDSVKGKPTAEEVRAGVEQLKFGVFDHEEVTNVPWVRVYKCMQMDNEVKEFNKRLAKEYSNGHRR